MSEHAVNSFEFWQDLNRVVSIKVEQTLRASQDTRAPVITYLRELEEMARKACSRRDTIQILVSGRRLLGDTTSVGVVDGPFARTLGLHDDR